MERTSGMLHAVSSRATYHKVIVNDAMDEYDQRNTNRL